MTPRYRNSSSNSEVRRASQTHQVPQVGCPHSAPVHKARKVNKAPVGAMALANKADTRVLKTQPTAAQKAIATYNSIDNQAAGTCTKMIR